MVMKDAGETTISRTMASGEFVRYSAPELIEEENVPVTANSDTYSFALLVLECITEEKPFSHIRHDGAVVHARITKRQCPLRPDVSDSLWDLMMHCWSIDPGSRPTMERVQTFFLAHSRDRL